MNFAHILQLLRDQVWGFVGVIIGIIFYIVDRIVEWIRQSRRALAHLVVATSSLPHPSDSSARILVWRLWNCGNESVLPQHYETQIEPIELMFGPNARVLTARVQDTRPKGMRHNLIVYPNKITLAPLLLNHQDSITLELWLARASDMCVNVHIAGETVDVAKYSERLITSARKLFKVVIVLFCAWILSIVTHVRYSNTVLYYVSIAFALLTCFVATLSILQYTSAFLRYRYKA